MASGSNPLGELSVLVSGDITALEEALNQIPSLAQSVASQVDQSFAGLSSNAGGVGDAATAAAVGVQDLSSAAASADASIGALSDSMAGAASEAQGVATETGNIAPELVSVGEESDSATEKITEFLETGLELAGVTLTLEAIKEALVDCVESFAEFQRAGEALTSITGNADAAAEAMERIPPIANQLAQSIPDLENFQQQLARFGVSLEAIPSAMQAASDASREAGVSFDTA